ncbi:hypothetical protein O6H91_10G046500 [Diphasiastrum complanatum]|uniref:Uncharacterized protein n=1 Tax=Diphasiastrum complanatum TaxID=34168 RepID=A0ACC2CGD0_DIPCM|nr:hypothetical protein O6H91_10G046500 [Diphasiastrum complanatum]
MEEDEAPCLSNLKRQLEEVEALRSIYSQEGEFQLTSAEKIALQMLQELDDISALELLTISFTISLKETQLFGRPISVAFSFPQGYPEACAAKVTVDCGGITRHWHECLNIGARSVAESMVGEEAVLQVLQKVQDLALELQEAEKCKSSKLSTMEPELQNNVLPSLKRKLMWFHHIKSIEKRKAIKDWGGELKLSGYCKPGFPGVLIFEGEDDNVSEYVKRIQKLHWQAVSVRAEEEEVGSSGRSIDDMRRFQLGIEEVGENGMSQLAGFCRDARLEHLFLSALKIAR